MPRGALSLRADGKEKHAALADSGLSNDEISEVGGLGLEGLLIT